MNEGSNGICDYMPERVLYPLDEKYYNTDAYWQGVANLQADSPAPNAARGGDNFFTLLGISKPHRNDNDLNRWESGEIKYNNLFIGKWYGTSEEELLVNASKEYPEIKTAADLKKYLGYTIEKVLRTENIVKSKE